MSLLIGELAFGVGTEHEAEVKIGVLGGSLLSALLATAVLRVRNRHHRVLRAVEQRDSDADGVPDVYQHEPATPGSSGRRHHVDVVRPDVVTLAPSRDPVHQHDRAQRTASVP